MVAGIVFRNDRVVTVDVLGAEKEVDQLSTTCAALDWLHCIDNEGNIVAPRGMHLNFVGPEVPCDWKLIDPAADGLGCYPGVVSAHLHKGLYHDLRSDSFLSSGDGIRMIFMPNAGVAAFTSWQPTLRTIVRRVGDTSVIITDYTEEAANMGLKELKKMVLREKACGCVGIFGGSGEPLPAAGESARPVTTRCRPMRTASYSA